MTDSEALDTFKQIGIRVYVEGNLFIVAAPSIHPECEVALSGDAIFALMHCAERGILKTKNGEEPL